MTVTLNNGCLVECTPREYLELQSLGLAGKPFTTNGTDIVSVDSQKTDNLIFEDGGVTLG